MKLKLMALLLALMLLAGCGTSQPASSPEESTFGSEEWADLMTPTPSQEPSPIPDKGTPPLEEDNEDDLGTEVTDEYKQLFLGTWDNDNGTMVYEFMANENLTITSSGGTATTFTYWFMDVAGQVRLNIFENGADDSTQYTFTIAGTNITLYNILSGSAVEVLHRRPEISAEPSVVPTVEPSATPSPTPVSTPTPTVTSAPSPVVSTEPPPVPSEIPETVPQVSPEPTENLDRPPIIDDGETEEVELPNVAMEAMSAIECVMDVMGSGARFDLSSPDFFWKVMARYISRMEGEGLSEGDTMTISTKTVEGYAKEVFADFTALPDLPSDTGLVNMTDGSYQIRFGEGGSMLDIQGYDEERGALVAGYNGTVYDISINANSAITSVSLNDDPAAQ